MYLGMGKEGGRRDSVRDALSHQRMCEKKGLIEQKEVERSNFGCLYL